MRIFSSTSYNNNNNKKQYNLLNFYTLCVTGNYLLQCCLVLTLQLVLLRITILLLIFCIVTNTLVNHPVS